MTDDLSPVGGHEGDATHPDDQPEHERTRFRTVGFVAGVTAGAILTICVAAYAASFSISAGTIGTSAVAQTKLCANDSFTYQSSSIRTRFVTSGSRYEIAQAEYDSIDALCLNKAVRITVLNTASPFDAIGNGKAAPNDGALTGVTFTAANNNIEAWALGDGPLLNNIDSGSSTVDLLVIVRG